MTTLILAVAFQGIPIHEATTPTSRLAEPWWTARHEEKLELSTRRFRLVFLGDSITQRWETTNPASWAGWQAANFGYNGDRTQHALWRITNGELINCRPDLVVILIGTNNLGHGPTSPAKAADGIKKLVQTIRQRRPAAKILLLPLIPRGRTGDEPIRKESDNLSAAIRNMANGYNTYFVDTARLFLNANRSLRLDRLMPDQVHPNPAGYAALSSAMKSKIDQLLAQ